MPIKVSFTDPTGRYTSQTALLVKNVEAAWAMWAPYLAPSDATIEIDFRLVTDYANRGGGRSVTSVVETVANGDRTAAQGSIYELRTGNDPNGATADIEVFFDVDFLAQWYFIDPLDGTPTPSGKNNLVDVIAHELGHALGFNGFSNVTTFALGNYASRFDRLIEVKNGLPYFVGEKAVALYGGAVPLTPGNVFHVGNTTTPIASDLMNGLTLRTGIRYEISALDIAILSDMGTATILGDKLLGSTGADVVKGGAGGDEIYGLGGDDRIDGGLGLDTAVYTGASSDFAWSKTADGSWSVRDLRSGSPDGTDTLKGIEVLKFTDKSVNLSSVSAVAIAGEALLRGGQVAAVADIDSKMSAGAVSQATAINSLILTAAQTTSVATLSYQFFTGKIPGDAGIDYLVSPTGPNSNNLNSAYYQSFNLENRYINFAVNLGKLGEGKEAFAAAYGALTLFEATKKAYAAIFGATPTDAKVHALIDSRIDYFAAYGGDGAGGLGTKAAMVGWLLAEAVKADVGVMAKANDAWLLDVSDGSAPFAISILDPAKGYYKADFVFGGT